MRRTLLVISSAIASALFFAACASHPARSFMPGMQPEAQSGSDAVTKVTVKITVATKSPALRSDARFPRYFSASSKGLLVQAFLHGKTKVLAQTAIDISPGSTACGGKKTTPRTCSATLSVAPSKGDDFAIFDYNAKPSSGKIAKSAKLLAYGKLTNKPVSTSAKKNSFSVFLGGVIAGLGGNPAFVSLPGDGSAHSVAILINPVDFGNNPITAGGKDSFANPITVSIVEVGGSGHMLLSLDGAAGASSVLVKHSTDTLELSYDGGGSIGYGATATLTSAKVKGQGGATESLNVGPLLLGSASADFSPGALALKGNGDYASVQIGEVNAPAGTVFTATTQNCDAIESTMPVIQSSATSGSFAAIARGVAATPNPAGCSIVVGDGSSNVTVVVSNVYSGSLGTPTISTTTLPDASAGPVEITVGPDGALWFAECNVAKIIRVPAGPIATLTHQSFSLPAPPTGSKALPEGVYAGPDGNLWFTEFGGTAVGKMTTAGTATVYPIPTPTTSPKPSFITAGGDGTMWFSNDNANYIANIQTSGSPIMTHSANLSDNYVPNMALGPDGNVWFTENAQNKIGKVTSGGTITEYPIPTANSYPWGITAGPDGAMWFTECLGGAGTGAIGRITTDGSSIQEFHLGMTGHNPVDITTGPDGALWFTYWTVAGKIGRITTAATPSVTTITEYAIPGASSTPNTWGITAGPDGAIWFVETTDNWLGRIKIASTPALRPAVKGSPLPYARTR
jgi:streptogramin lyase